jgi:multiple sugar transport system substrate-binding protein
MKRRTSIAAVAGSAAVALVLAACGSGGGGSSASSTTLTAVLWDPTQLPVYQQCAADFKKQSGITVTYSQVAWTNYWQKLTTELAAGTAPDIITDHVAYYASLQQSGQLVDLAPYLKQDNYDLNQYNAPSNALWNVGGKQYAVSQDQDVEGLLYNTKDIPSDTPTSSLSTLTWDPTGGGTFQKMIEHLTVDQNGNRGDSPSFDKSKVKIYGFGMEPGPGVVGQTSWSPFVLSTGWNYTDKNPFGTKYFLDDPNMVKAWTWLQAMYKGGYIAPVSQVSSLGEQPALDQNLVAMMTQGSWEAAQRLPSYDKAQTFAWAQLPSGPVGHPVSITNSIGPSVTSSSKHAAEAARYIEYLASPACADVVAASGVEIPIVPEAATKALANLQKQGVDTSYWQTLLSTPADVRLTPITTHGAEITSLGNTAFDDTLAPGQGAPQNVLSALNTAVNALLSQ